MPDRTPEPAEGERQRYTLPNEYGPARPPLGNDDDLFDDDTPTVTLHERDAVPPPQTVGSAATESVAPTVATVAVTANGQGSGAHPKGPRLSSRGHVGSCARSANAPRPRRSRRPRPPGHRVRSAPSGSAAASRSRWCSLLIPVAVSYVDYLQRPGSDTLSVRTVEWIRDHGGNGIVNTIERWWYTNNPPPTGGKPSAIKVQDTVTDTTTKTETAPPTYPQIQRLAPPTARVPTPAPVVEPNEGVWQPTGRLVVGAACRLHHVRAPRRGAHLLLHGLDVARHQVAPCQLRGRHRATRRRAEPVGIADPANRSATSRSPRSTRGSRWTPPTAAPTSTARRSSRCGATRRRSSSIRTASANVGVWGRDFIMSPDIKAVRQNLALIVDNGQLNPALQENDTTAVRCHPRATTCSCGVRASGSPPTVRSSTPGVPRCRSSPWRAPCRPRARCGRWRWTSTPTG